MITNLPLSAVALRPGEFERRRRLNREYLLSLTDDNLLQNHYIEAGISNRLWQFKPSSEDPTDRGVGRHWGWESPSGELRGHFLGHWMSAAAREVAATGDALLAARVSSIVAELERCQRENGGEWVFGIPQSFMHRLAQGRAVWAPQYNVHKTLMGLVDVARECGDSRALAVAHRAATWFDRWAASFDDETFDEILDVETGGMLEIWADLLSLTGDEMYRRLLNRYDRRRLFDPLIAGADVLTNKHANTTIPEVLGAARAYEVTGEQRWADIVTSYWEMAVTTRGTYCTGGQTAGEIWTPPFEFAARRGDKNQELCTVYNMIRLADVLFRWTGERDYLDYIERNLYNGILAQQNNATGMVSYFLPLESGARKLWGTPTEDFWCCHGTLVQAHTRHQASIAYLDEGTLIVAQYIPSTLTLELDGRHVVVRIERSETADRVGPEANAGRSGSRHRPESWQFDITIESDVAAVVPLRLRIPGWVQGEPSCDIDGGESEVCIADGFATLSHPSGRTRVRVSLPCSLQSEPIPDEPETVAFVHGPVVLAGLTDRELRLHGDPNDPTTILAPDNERQWAQWLPGFRSIGQQESIRFAPLYLVRDETYTVYFPVTNRVSEDIDARNRAAHNGEGERA
ncbi:beta-L-arabinofuranosidase domain-containing protein [Paramicrobacterium fandaimingii]|uniref:beta-L-arabinofuranosidase domain-containing protein n=1 Tax=Paramicrobacterium fandaimingii TaxID=2708079 RepID=UPI001421AD8A|nr:beta-L-arabinofuranosidase domain-containing protein [Microbacterium fandaimingii]